MRSWHEHPSRPRGRRLFFKPSVPNQTTASTQLSIDDAWLYSSHSPWQRWRSCNRDRNAAPSASRSLTQLESTTPQKPLNTIDEIHEHYGSTCERSTLNDSKEHPKELSYIILFPGANPRWKPDRIIFAKTNISILPGYKKFKAALDEETKQAASAAEAGTSEKDATNGTTPQDPSQPSNDSANPLQPATPDQPSAANYVNIELENPTAPPAPATAPSDESTPTNTRPIPVFLDLAFKYTPRKYCFHGYFTPARVDFLKPGSPELVRMLEQKFTQPSSRGGHRGRGRGQQAPRQRERDPAAWKKSLDLEWAVMFMRRCPDEEVAALGEPEIERYEENQEVRHGGGTWGTKDGETVAEAGSGRNEGEGGGKGE